MYVARIPGGHVGNLPNCILKLKNLETLHMDYQSLTTIPHELGDLKKLTEVWVSYNPLLESVTPELSTLQSLARKNTVYSLVFKISKN